MVDIRKLYNHLLLGAFYFKMTNNLTSLTVETIAFSEFQNSYEEIEAYCLLTLSTINDPWFPSDIEQIKFVKNQEKNTKNFFQMLPILKTGHSIATKLAIVYLAAIVEAYTKDALMELTDRRIKRINHTLMGKPIPTNEEEDIIIDIELEEAEQNSDNPFYMFAEKTREYIQSRINRNTVRESLKFLKNLFRVEIQNKDIHLCKWDNLRKLRNNIVHHRRYSKEKFSFPTTKSQHTIDDISISPDQIKQALDDIFNFVYAIEFGIFKSLQGNGVDV